MKWFYTAPTVTVRTEVYTLEIEDNMGMSLYRSVNGFGRKVPVYNIFYSTSGGDSETTPPDYFEEKYAIQAIFEGTVYGK